MKRYFILCMAICLTCTTLNAQSKNGMFNHLSVGVNAGTPGAGVDIAVPVLGEYISLRAGYSFIPKLSVNTTLDLSGEVPTEIKSYSGKTYSIPQEVDAEGKLNIANAKILADVYPFKKSSFHITAGAYIGSGDVITLTNKTNLKSVYDANQDIKEYNKMIDDGTITGEKQDIIGVELGDYLLTADQNGNIKGNIKTSVFKPYLGLGFGRAVPHKSVGFMFEAGCMFWGSPKVVCNGTELTSENVGGEGGDVIEIISKINIYPVINFRLCFKAF